MEPLTKSLFDWPHAWPFHTVARRMLENLLRAVRFLLTGQFRRVWNEVHVRIYRVVWEGLWLVMRPGRRRGRPAPTGVLARETKHPVAYESPDHLAPKGTAENNSTNKKFVLHMDAKLHREFTNGTLNIMDLGCSGGQMVADFIALRWRGVGMEGSDYSLKHRRAHWAELANKNLFTGDITKPFQVTLDGEPPGPAAGLDTAADGRGAVAEQRLYQLVRQPGEIADRTFRIDFDAPGVEAYVFTFG